MPNADLFPLFLLLSEMTSKQVSDSNNQQINDLHRLIKKYHAIRNIVKILTVINTRDNIIRKLNLNSNMAY